MRNWLTDAERVLWMQLRTKPKGYKFRRQHPAGNYILDFYCHALKLAIKADGDIHNKEKVQEADRERQKNLESEGIYVIRFTNKEIMVNMKSVTEQINTDIDKRISSLTVGPNKLPDNDC